MNEFAGIFINKVILMMNTFISMDIVFNNDKEYVHLCYALMQSASTLLGTEDNGQHADTSMGVSDGFCG